MIIELFGGRALKLTWGFAYPLITNSEFHLVFSQSQAVGSKFHCQEEKSPDRRIRPPNLSYSVKEVRVFRQPGGWLRSSHPLKKA